MSNTQFPFNITDESVFHGSQDKVFLLEWSRISRYINSRHTPSLKKVEHFFQRWKEYPEVWDLYYTALNKNKCQNRAEEVLESMAGLFPDYIYGLCSYVLLLIRRGETYKAEQYLGQTPAMELSFPWRDTFSYNEVLSYYSVFIEMAIAKEDYDKAEQYLDLVAGIDGLGNYSVIFHYRLRIMNSKWLVSARKRPPYIKPAPPRDYRRTAFVHPQIEDLFNHVRLLDKSTIDSILLLPRQTAIADLEQILYRTMFEFTEEDYDKEMYYSLPHALWFLYAFNALESAPLAGYLLQMDYSFIEYWFGDVYIENTWFLFFLFLKEGAADSLLEVLRKPNMDAYSKYVAFEAMEQLVFHYPETKEKVAAWLGDLLAFYIENMDNKDIIDTTAVCDIEYTALNIRAENLLPQLKILHENDCINQTICAGYQFVEEEMKSSDILENDKKKLPSVYDLAEKERIILEEDAPGDNPVQPAEPTCSPPKAPKAGRNDPCPCGSGKKYKKCCLK